MTEYKKHPVGVTALSLTVERGRERQRIARAGHKINAAFYADLEKVTTASNGMQERDQSVIVRMSDHRVVEQEDSPKKPNRTPLLNDDLFNLLKPAVEYIPKNTLFSDLHYQKDRDTSWMETSSQMTWRQKSVFSEALVRAREIYNLLSQDGTMVNEGIMVDNPLITVRRFSRLHDLIRQYEEDGMQVLDPIHITPRVRFIAELFQRPKERHASPRRLR